VNVYSLFKMWVMISLLMGDYKHDVCGGDDYDIVSYLHRGHRDPSVDRGQDVQKASTDGQRPEGAGRSVEHETVRNI